MAHPEVDSTRWRFDTSGLVERLGGLGLFAIVGVAILGNAAGGPEWLVAWHVTASVLLLTGVLIVAQFLRSEPTEFRSDLQPYRFGAQLVLLVGLLGITYQSQSPGFGLGIDRAIEATIIFLGLVAFCVLARDPRRYSAVQWLVIGCVATVVGIFFYHSVSIAEVSFRSRHPVWAGFIMAVGLIVLPQYLSREQFLWAVNRLAAVLVLLTVPVYVIGEYTLFGLSFTFHGAYTIPVVDHEVQATRSLFVNRNAFAVVVFTGLVAAVSEVHRSYIRETPTWTVVVPAALLAINGVGLAIAYGRALWVITPMAVGVYLAYVAFGRRAVPFAVVGGFAYLVTGIAAVHNGIIPLPEGTPTRAERWYPSVAAILDQPSLLGAGLVDPGQVIAEYHPTGSSGSPHNSYLTMGIRAGLLGGIAYVLVMLSSLLHGILWDRDVDVAAGVAMLALAVGFTAHQQFEAYTLFNWASGTVLAVLVFGFLVFAGADRPSRTSA
ncbi:hypothetical protein HWV07_17885 [Natronomonas salina]|uniref:O-antigen ligase family protein n=1 Tax=Natronomonas salina TaxID=1710540 RepID=UPI0015B3F8C2|nr:hypothetical protein [Natronomonas salina]QLD90811.1 hypothetical protein HWV07_17885 [Natronomonas salina]